MGFYENAGYWWKRYTSRATCNIFADRQVFSYIHDGKAGLNEAAAGILIAHVSHLLSTIILYNLSQNICRSRRDFERTKFAFLVALLHVISPAGVFLSAPYAESPFALLNFLGFHLYTKGHNHEASSNRIKGDGLLLAAGLMFGIATMFRSNGLLSGLVFAYDAIALTWMILQSRSVLDHLRGLCVTVLGGSLVAMGSVLPQFLALLEYCSEPAGDARQWCTHLVPSIYSWVQSHYW